MNRTEKDFFVNAFQVNPMSVVFIDDTKDPLFSFWKMMKGDLLPEKCLIVIPEMPLTEDLQDVASYGAVRVGRGAMFNYDVLTQPGIKPSQHGIFYRR